eukprot:78535_1
MIIAIRRYAQIPIHKLENIEATKLIRNFHKNKSTHKETNDRIIDQAICIYNNVNSHKDSILINALIKLFLHYQCPDKCAVIWHDIEQECSHRTLLSFSLLKECCVKSYAIGLDQCVQVMQCNRSNHNDAFITQIISKYKENYNELQQIHSLINNGVLAINNQLKIKTALIHAYCRCHDVSTASQLFHSIRNKDTVCINAMMTGYLSNNCNEEVLQLYDNYDRMHDTISHILAIKACTNCKQIEKGKAIHRSIMRNNNHTTLNKHYMKLHHACIDFYSACEEIETALNIFHSMEHKDADTVNTIMKALCQNGCSVQALDIYNTCTHCNDDTHLWAIKACTKSDNIEQGQAIERQLEFDKLNVYVWAEWITFYAHFGDTDAAVNTFNSAKNVHGNDSRFAVCVAAMMNVWIHNHYNENALAVYRNCMARHDDVSHLLAFRACVNLNAFEDGKRIYQQIEHKRNTFSVHLLNAILHFFAHFGDMQSAQTLFHERMNHHQRCSSTLNAMTKCLIHNQMERDALSVLDEYDTLQDAQSVILALKACVHLNDLNKGKEIETKCNWKRDLHLLSRRIDFYGHFGDVDAAFGIFNETPTAAKNSVILNTMMTVYHKHKMYDALLDLYEEHTTLHDAVSHLLAIDSCSNTHYFEQGKRIIDEYIGSSENHDKLNCALIDFYGRCKELENAVQIFESMDENAQNNSVCVGSMMSAFISAGCNEKAISLYTAHEDKNDILHLLALRAYKSMNYFEEGKRIHQMMIDSDASIGNDLQNAWIDFYGYFGDIDAAQHVFDSIVTKNIQCAETMCGVFYDKKMNCECVEFFGEFVWMRYDVNALSAKCVANVLRACARTQDIHLGQQIHDALNQGLASEISVQISLIYLYGSCGMIELSEQVFNDKYWTEIGIWNAMIDVFGRNGDALKAKQLFEQVMCDGLSPDRDTFLFVLNALGHAGHAHEALCVWNEQMDDEEMKYNMYIVTALVDGLSRSNLLDDAYRIMMQYQKKMKGEEREDITMQIALLNGCVKHLNTTIAAEVYNQIKRQCQNNPNKMQEADILMSNLYQSLNVCGQCIIPL